MTSSARPPRTVLAVSRAWYLAVAAVVVLSIAIQIALLLTGGADANSGETGEVAPVAVRLIRLFSFFTIDSNLVVLLVSLLLVADPLRRGFWWEALRLNAVVAITVTGVVYAVLLAPNIRLEGWAAATMIGLHVVSPVGFVAAWLVLGPRRRLRFAHVPAAFVLPALWVLATFVHGAFAGWYPYPFVDVTDIGMPAAIRNAVLILGSAAVLALICCLVDRSLPALPVKEPRGRRGTIDG